MANEYIESRATTDHCQKLATEMLSISSLTELNPESFM